ncbi:MAG: OmpA family protein [Alphaproteobacteria bacterium]|nr:OmpA family protein [Alphaproteobacteria bacterium]
MRLKTAALLASAWLAGTGMAFGQTVDSGMEVTVNPVTGGRGGLLLYPGDQYMRRVQPALEPGETLKDQGPIQLHMPVRRKTIRKAPTTQTATAEQAPAVAPRPQPEKPVAKPKPQPKVAAAAPPPPAAAYNPGFGSFDQGAAGLNLSRMPPASPPPPTQMAKANPPPANVTAPPAAGGETPGLSKRSVILFAPQAADPAESALGAIKFLAGDLNSAMTSASSRVQIQAYGGNRGDKGSDARRLSLKRALAIRQVLIDDGVAAERIDVRAMGGVDDKGPADRVDVFVKS